MSCPEKSLEKIINFLFFIPVPIKGKETASSMNISTFGFLIILILRGSSYICIISDPYSVHAYKALKILQ